MKYTTLEIAVMRHGQPETPNFGKIKPHHFQDCLNIYNEAKLLASSRPSDTMRACFEGYGIVVASDLRRSQESAQYLASHNRIITDVSFREVQLPSLNLPIMRLNAQTWADIFHKLWMFRCLNASESPSAAQKRGQMCAEKLINLACEHNKVLLAGHSIINSYIVSALQKMGWSGPRLGKEFWSYAVYKKQLR